MEAAFAPLECSELSICRGFPLLNQEPLTKLFWLHLVCLVSKYRAFGKIYWYNLVWGNVRKCFEIMLYHKSFGLEGVLF